MAWTASNPVTIGNATKKSDYDKLWDNVDYLMSMIIPIAVAGGTVDAITADYSPNIALTDMRLCAIVATGANTSTTPTFNPDGLGALTIVKNGGAALSAGDIPAEHAVCLLAYNLAHTRWELVNPAT